MVPDGHYEFLKVQFGLCNSPTVFQRHVRAVRPLIDDGIVLAYLDDLIVPADTDSEALKKLRQVLKTGGEYGLVINWRKCSILVKQVNYLGYIIENGQIRPSQQKTLAVSRFPEPKTTKQVQSFLGLTGYYRKFIESYAVIARPLSYLLRNNVGFKFGPLEKEAFERLKKSLN